MTPAYAPSPKRAQPPPRGPAGSADAPHAAEAPQTAAEVAFRGEAPGPAGAPPAASGPPRFALFENAFRPFFLGVGIWGAGALAVWLLAWRGIVGLPPAWPGSWWHAHEMLFGVVGAAIAGFLLTAVPVWTGSARIRGGALLGLVLLWAAGRAAMGAAGALPAGLVLAVDVAFLPAVALVIGRRILAARSRRNAAFPAVLLALAVLNAAVHLDLLGALSGVGSHALRATVDLVVLLIVVVGGRITPLFTRNALRAAGSSAEVRPGSEWGALGIAAVVALAAGDLFAPRSLWTGSAAGIGAAALFLRQAGWQGPRAVGDPLLLSLHLGVLWVPAGLALVAAHDLAGLVPPAAGLHALTAGAMGATVLAVVTRVALGHTGRPFAAGPAARTCYALVHLGAVLRVASPFAAAPAYATLVTVGGILWGAAFLLFAASYLPILAGPRVDGRPG